MLIETWLTGADEFLAKLEANNLKKFIRETGISGGTYVKFKSSLVVRVLNHYMQPHIFFRQPIRVSNVFSHLYDKK